MDSEKAYQSQRSALHKHGRSRHREYDGASTERQTSDTRSSNVHGGLSIGVQGETFLQCRGVDRHNQPMLEDSSSIRRDSEFVGSCSVTESMRKRQSRGNPSPRSSRSIDGAWRRSAISGDRLLSLALDPRRAVQDRSTSAASRPGRGCFVESSAATYNICCRSAMFWRSMRKPLWRFEMRLATTDRAISCRWKLSDLA